jgi:putative ABC transport system permease protein
MFDRELWLEIAHTVTANPLRTALTGLSVGLGIFILVVMQGLGFGLQHGVESTFSDQASNTIWVDTDRSSLPYRGRAVNTPIWARNQDFERLTQEVSDPPEKSIKLWFWGSLFKVGNKEGNYQLYGVQPDYKNLNGIPMTGGRFLSQADCDGHEKVCVVGGGLVKQLFEDQVVVGSYIEIRGVSFRVIGQFDSPSGRWANNSAYIPASTAQRLFHGSVSAVWMDWIDQMVLSTGDLSPTDAAAMAQDVDWDLRNHLAVHPDDQRGLSVHDNNEDAAMFQRIFLGIRLFIWGIGGLTLLAGAIGVANIMGIVVKERTVEFGVRKALGATPGSVIKLIVVEAVALTLVSGSCGLLAGVALLEYGAPMMQHEFFSDPSISFNVTLVALGVLVVAGAMSGFFPARRAVRIRPVEALRSE